MRKTFMNWLDIIIAVPLLWGLWQGFRQGFIVQIIGLAALFVGVYAAFVFGSRVGALFQLEGFTATVTGFIAVFSIVVIALFFIGRVTRGLFKIAGLGIFDTLLGVVFSMLKTLLIIGVLLMWLSDIDHDKTIIKESAARQSRLFEPVMKISQAAFPYLESFKDKILNPQQQTDDEHR